MLLDDAHNFLGWPTPDQVLDPVGSGARIYADFAKQKIGAALRRQFSNLQVETGVLAADPNSDSTEAPIAVVCQFPSGADDDMLDFAHKLAWNFSRTALLITLEPYRLIAWSCCQHPKETLQHRRVCELPSIPNVSMAGGTQQRAVRDLLHWVSLITGNLLKSQPEKFPAEGRADALLLKDLKNIRRELLSDGLPENYCHDLLARVIFTQFLFHRKDSDGRPFFDELFLKGRCQGALRRDDHKELASILADKNETYALFGWLDEKFNGDLFPGKENQTDEERERAWKDEKDSVTRNHLHLLADFVSGRIDTSTKQLTLWPQYSFDTIPLEFISSVYEEFLNEEKLRDKAYYTPAHLVDFVLDAVLPWNGEEWDLKVLDASCGSGIFLVKAFQRLIHRWRRENKGKDPLVSDLKPILANNLIGVDKNEEAVRVACFSLYLAMADAIEPRYYLKREKVFPRLRGTQLIAQDFFDESTPGYRTKEDAGSFDLVLGNAPWGARSIKSSSNPAMKDDGQERIRPTKAEQWANNYEWPVANYDIGPLFLAKALKLVKQDGRVAMVQPASTLLYLRSGQALKLRQKLFTEFSIDEVANLSALRWELFPQAVGPACVIVCSRPRPSPSDTFLYFYPKPLLSEESGYRFTIEPQDVNRLSHLEAASEPIIWSALALGGRRDFLLAKRLSKFPTIGKLQIIGDVTARKGIVRGRTGRQKRQHELLDKPILETATFPKDRSDEILQELNVQRLPLNKNPLIEKAAAVDLEPFKMPQFIVKKSWPVQQRRFEAAIVKSDEEWGAICTQSYVTVHDRKTRGQIFRGAWLTYNSRLAFYLLALKSSRLGHYRPEPLLEEFLDLPIPKDSPASLRGITTATEIDNHVRELFRLRESEWVLVEDLTDVTFLDVTSSTHSVARKHTTRTYEPSGSQSEPKLYAQTFVRVVRATFGNNKSVSATVFEEPSGEKLPVRMVAIHLEWPGHESVAVETMRADALMDDLKKLYAHSLEHRKRTGSGSGLGFQRVAFLFHSHTEAHGRVRSLYIIKPDQQRYWTRSLAMRDADQLSAAILKAAGRKTSNA